MKKIFLCQSYVSETMYEDGDREYTHVGDCIIAEVTNKNEELLHQFTECHRYEKKEKSRFAMDMMYKHVGGFGYSDFNRRMYLKHREMLVDETSDIFIRFLSENPNKYPFDICQDRRFSEEMRKMLSSHLYENSGKFIAIRERYCSILKYHFEKQKPSNPYPQWIPLQPNIEWNEKTRFYYIEREIPII